MLLTIISGSLPSHHNIVNAYVRTVVLHSRFSSLWWWVFIVQVMHLDLQRAAVMTVYTITTRFVAM